MSSTSHLTPAQIQQIEKQAQGQLDTGINNFTIPGVQQIKDANSALNSVGNFLSFLGSKDASYRIGEFIVGAVLVTVGLVHLMKSDGSIQSTGKGVFGTAQKAGKTGGSLGRSASATGKAVAGKAKTAGKAAKAIGEAAVVA